MKNIKQLCSIVLACPALCLAAPAPSFGLSSQSAIYDKSHETITFTMNFLEVPDFGKVNNRGQYYAFQYFVNPDSPGDYDSIIRGGELAYSGDKLIIRESHGGTGPVPDPNAGGWGVARGKVDYSLEGKVFSFTVPVGMVSDHGAAFSYRLVVYEDVYKVSDGVYHVSGVPEPGSGTLMLGGLAVVGLAFKRRLSPVVPSAQA